MVDFVKGNLKELVDDIGEAELPEADRRVGRRGQARDGPPDKAIAEDTKLLFEDFTCIDCHKFHDAGARLGGARPDRLRLAGVDHRHRQRPTHPRFYRDDNDRMPSLRQRPRRPGRQHPLHAARSKCLPTGSAGTWYEPEK